MNTTDYNETVNEIIRPHLTPIGECVHGWIILIDGQVWTKNDRSAFIFRTRKQAVSSFYHYMKWKAVRALGNRANDGSYWRNASQYWRRFKELLGDRLEIKEI